MVFYHSIRKGTNTVTNIPALQKTEFVAISDLGPFLWTQVIFLLRVLSPHGFLFSFHLVYVAFLW